MVETGADETRSSRILVMGVSGSGKTHIGRLVAERLGAEFIDGDDYHSPASIDKMARGVPLNDEDRKAWLETLARKFAEYRKRGASVVIGCSALKRRYRDTLRRGDPSLKILFLSGDREQLHQRLTSREGHFFKGDRMLDSQLADLEPPGEDEAVELNIALSPDRLADGFVQRLAP
ncbi:gluconate kinase, SKI family [Halomonas korlensis]|uniref:Gluconokinase n=2 Tax=Halomonas korlensis TaxID=463301 RepID=A0A1I7IMX9_9GAMM|nr:gluconate kinase, SKI family [Halomonas korlensis]